MLFSVWFPKEIRYVCSHCWAFWGHSSHPVPFDPNKDPTYPVYQISLKLFKDTKLLQVLFKNQQWIGDTHGITSTKGKVAAGIQQSPAQLAASTHPGAKQTYLTVHSHAGTVRQYCMEEGRKEVCSRKGKVMQWEGQGIIPLSLVKEINTNSQGRQTSPKFCCLQSKVTHSVLSDTFSPGPLTSAMPSLLFLWHTYTHFTYSAYRSVIQFFIFHQHPLDQCSGARLLVMTTMTQTPLALKPDKHNPVTSCKVPTDLAEQPLATTLLHTLSRVLLIPQAWPSRFTVAGTQYFLTLTCSPLTVLIWNKMPVETDIYMNTTARKSESSGGWFFKTEGGN